MNLYKKAISIFFSIGTSITLLAIFAFLSGYGTFVENDYSTQTAQALVYGSGFFEILLVLICINLTGNIIKNKLYKMNKIIIFMFHISFIFIALGALITRYVGYEGTMSIKENKSKSYMLSSDLFLLVNLSHGNLQENFEKKISLSEIYKNFVNNFSDDVQIKDKFINIKYKDFIKNAVIITKENVPNGEKILNFAISNRGVPHDVFLKYGESIVLSSGEIVSFFDNKNAFISFDISDNNLSITSKENITKLNMATEEVEMLEKDVVNVFEPKRLYTSGNINIVFKSFHNKAKLQYKTRFKEQSILDVLIVDVSLNGKSKEFVLYGDKNVLPIEQMINIDDVDITLSYGPNVYPLPFSIHLYDFILDRYPGSSSPSSFKSKVRLNDERFNINEDREIFMNNVLYHDGYRFYQSSYFPDESGTILSVNHDYIGTIVTYFGYFLLMFGLLLTIFNPKGRIRKLQKKLEKLRGTLLVLLALSFFSPIDIYAKIDDNKSSIITQIKQISKSHSNKLASLQVQDNSGLIKPIDTLSSSIIRKVSGKTSLFDLDSNQIFLSMLTKPALWQSVKMIKIKNKRIKEVLGVDKKTKYLSFKHLFDYNSTDIYKLISFVDAAHQKKPAERATFDKDIIKLDEKVNILYMVYTGSLLKVFPHPTDKNDSTWYDPIEAIKIFDLKGGNFVRSLLATYFTAIEQAGTDGNWSQADNVLNLIKLYQDKTSKIKKTDEQIELEIIYNNLDIFNRLTYVYLILALIFIAMSIISIFKKDINIKRYTTYAKRVLLIAFISHFIALALRWIISGHAPWSNGYESMIYVSFTMILAAFLISRKSILILSGATLVAGITLFVAHTNWMNPEITNLVPVLKSYWLSIHVSIIIASYGFFAISFILGIFYMFMVLSTNKSNYTNIDKAKQEISYINEISIYIGLICLTIGNFLGGIWANESWGRYWGWDAKETWALVSILVYAIIAHFRFIPLLKGYFIFNASSILAFYSILMTYFGVNFYLSGLHSYAQGDSMEIPMWVYYLSSFIILLIMSAFVKDKINERYSKD